MEREAAYRRIVASRSQATEARAGEGDRGYLAGYVGRDLRACREGRSRMTNAAARMLGRTACPTSGGCGAAALTPAATCGARRTCKSRRANSGSKSSPEQTTDAGRANVATRHLFESNAGATLGANRSLPRRRSLLRHCSPAFPVGLASRGQARTQCAETAKAPRSAGMPGKGRLLHRSEPWRPSWLITRTQAVRLRPLLPIEGR